MRSNTQTPMSSRALAALAAGTLTLALALAGCGGSASPAASTVSGVVSSDALVSGTVALKDSSMPRQERTAVIDGSGSFALDAAGLTPPYLLRAESADGAGAFRMYSVAGEDGTAEVNPMTDAAFAVASDAEGGAEDAYDGDDVEQHHRMAAGFAGALGQLRSVLQPLLDLYGVSVDPANHDGPREALRAMLRDVRFAVRDGQLVVTNAATGAVIFSGSMRDLASGTFYPENLPTPGTTTPPAACTYAYSEWGTCQADGTQTRAVTSSSPAGCAGTPILSQACGSVPPPPASCTYTYSAWGACQPDGTQARTVASSSPAGCTGTPDLSQACTYLPPPPASCTYTYSAWGACQPDGTQARTVASSSPAGCTGTPALSQACAYVPPPTIDGAALYDQTCSRCHGPLATSTVRGVTADQITAAGMTHGLTPAEVQAVADALK